MRLLDEKCFDPGKMKPMMAANTGTPPRTGRWMGEFKWDGMRALFAHDGRGLTIISRNSKDITGSFPEFEDVEFERPVVIDGELISPDDRGLPDFHRLQKRMHISGRRSRVLVNTYPVVFMAFDILNISCQDIMDQPYVKRREILKANLPDHPVMRLSKEFEGEIEHMIDVAKENGLEGLILKKADSPYLAGKRSGNWLKLKFTKTADLVVGGWKPRKNSGIGSLLLGAYSDRDELVYVGSVGTGFDRKDHAMLQDRLLPLSRETPPFSHSVPRGDVRFVDPRVVIEVEYRRWPRSGKIQQAAFKGIRSFKGPGEVRLSAERG